MYLLYTYLIIMQLMAFHIKNFRSIIDSRINYLSPDNITALIGQNESGKTSVLEALHSFYNGIISDDILRSDLSLPWVSCEFKVEEAIISSMTQQYDVPQEIADYLNKNKRIFITRSWNEDKTSCLELSGDEINDYYAQQNAKIEQEETLLLTTIDEFDNKGKALEAPLKIARNELESAKKEHASIEQQIASLQKQLRKTKNNNQKDQFQNQVDKLQLDLEQARVQIEQNYLKINDLNSQYNTISEKVKFARMTKNSRQLSESMRQRNELLLQQIHDLEKIANNLTVSREIKAMHQKIEKARKQYGQEKLMYNKLRNDFAFNKTITSLIFQDIDYEEAKKLTIKQLSTSNNTASASDLGNALIKYCPVFALFEDFSSLLPNRVDLDDILNKNSSVEGYKAVRNFLTVAGIDASFFDHPNNRILKQKIENLNGEITINFQDFWRQNIGKNNKIKINFELEHYDYRYPEKKGRPYLEFWIKDAHERLYPKQRSRGVRWFLSFYLELKATALQNLKNQVLLIDEPGISLHARAQEDVLKVFEDIKDNLTIIYTTHSPHLIDINKLYRILAVQRAIEDDDSSETHVFDIRSLAKASTDTLSPLYSLMGSRFNDQPFIHKFNNVIVEDISTYYFLSALFRLVYPDKEVYILPSTDVTNIPTLTNLLLGWKLNFVIFLSSTSKGNMVYQELRTNLFANQDGDCDRKIVKMENRRNIIDYFSTIDFKNHILHQRTGITESNSEYVENNELSLVMMSMEFMNTAVSEQIKFSDFDEETQSNIHSLLNKIIERV
jgi:predicted ATP-dependent endonuclease of OLD family